MEMLDLPSNVAPDELLKQFSQRLHPQTSPAAAEHARKTIAALLEDPSIAPLMFDWEDFLVMMNEADGLLTTSYAQAGDVEQAAAQAIAACTVQINTAYSAIVLLSFSSLDTMKLTQVKQAVNKVKTSIAGDVNFISAATIDPTLGTNVGVTIIAGGLAKA